MNKELNEAAEKYAQKYKTQVSSEGLENIADDFKAGAQWQLEQKQIVSDEEIEKMAEKEYPEKKSIDKYCNPINLNYDSRVAFINGFKSALQYSEGGFSEFADLMRQFEKRNNISIAFHLCSDGSCHFEEFWKDEILKECETINEAVQFLKNTDYELDENGLCFSPVRPINK